MLRHASGLQTSNPAQNIRIEMVFGLPTYPFATWAIAALTVVAMFLRPRQIPEAV